MLVIRLARKGRRNHPMYRLLVAEHSKPTDGDFVEIVGHYDPTAPDQPLTVNKERVQYWISKGALPSNSVAKLLNRTGFDLPVEEKHRKPKKEVLQAGASGPEAPVEEPKPAAQQKEAGPAAEISPVEVPKEEAPAAEEAPVPEEKPAEGEGEAPAAEPAPETGSGEES